MTDTERWFIGMDIQNEIVAQLLEQHLRLHPCLCGCGQSTQRRFHPGHDSQFYSDLRTFADAGDKEAEALLLFTYKNNKPSTFDKQRQMATDYLEKRRN